MRTLKGAGIVLAIVIASVAFAGTSRFNQDATTDGPLDHLTALSVTGQADSVLEATWSTTLYQNERAYCGSWTVQDGRVIVFYATPAQYTRGVSWNTISFSCPEGAITIHTHPPQDCNPVGTYCAHTTWREAECAGSPQDQLARLGDSPPFGVVQCGRNVFGLFFAPRFIPPIRSTT